MSFNRKVTILPSLVRPKKITIRASDGNEYSFLCKPKDDLRKDSRLMEFNCLINKLLKKDDECRQRQLYIRTYTVLPLNEECGILEWVNNTTGIRNILNDLYRAKNLYTRARDIKAVFDCKDAKINKRANFEHKLMPKFPPVFSDWFVENFPDPLSW